MKVIYSEKHREHAPPCQFADGRMMASPEVPERADVILRALQECGMVDVVAPRQFSMEPILVVHDVGYLKYLENVYEEWVENAREPGVGLIPDTFAMRTLNGKPEGLVYQAGYYCFETQTPILEGTFQAAQHAAWCALTGAELLQGGERAAYALCRPPGHHAAGDVYGGYCYLNHAAIAVRFLNAEGQVAVLDIDYHHGNGTQAIFYDSDDVLFVSIHADPNRQYPYFSGYEDEKGMGVGRGLNVNFPLEAGIREARYLDVLDQALGKIAAFAPAFLVVSLGADIYREDPLGDFELSVDVFGAIGRRIEEMGVRTLFVQEGGYHLDTLGVCIANTLVGFESMC
ncbi:MAG: histone deacetylase family protein [bacterium]|nr:histone deacetylase family protein [bacterium]